MNPRLLKRLDGVVGPLLSRMYREKQAPDGKTAPLSILFIRPGGIGDAVLLVPALRALKTAYPGCTIDILAEKRNAAVFGLTSVIRTVHCYDSLSGIAAVLRGSFDVVIDTEQWYRLSAVVARLTGAPMLIGFATNDRKRLFSHPVCYAQARYEVCSFFTLLEPLGIASPSGSSASFLELPAEAVEAAGRLLAPLSGRPFLTIFPGASTPEKQWGGDRFRELTSILAARGMAVVVVGGEDTRAAAQEVCAGNRALDLVGKSSLAVTAALIAKGRALVSGDSGLLHIAAGLGTPTVSLFGPSDPRKWGPQGEHHLVLGSGLPCAPCSLFGTVSSCPIKANCLSQITVAEVVAAVAKLLGREAGCENTTPVGTRCS